MRKSDLYTITLDPLIESYLDILKFTNTNTCCGKKKDFLKPKTTNKAGATNNSKHPLAQQVEVWADKK